MPHDNEGLSSKEAKGLLQKFGPNKLPEKPSPSSLFVFISQLRSPLVYVLVAAAVVTLLLGDIPDTIIISIAVFVNTILGFVQERKASQALYALKKLIHPEATVIRDGKVVTIAAEDVVPGDIAVLNQGHKVPGDGVILKANRMFIEEAILTGESMPVSKAGKDKAFLGTIISAGNGEMLVEHTGEETEIGKIAESIQDSTEDTPLKRQLRSFSKQLLYLVLILIGIVFVIGVVSGKDILDVFTTSVALAVSAIPEGLIVGLTVVLAIGMRRILARQGLVRNLVSAETLGGVTTICVDKTGTLTQGKMSVLNALGSEADIAKQAILANDYDDPIVVAAWEWAKSKVVDHKALITRHKRFDSIPFSPSTRYFASLNKKENENIIYVNGAPEYLMDWSTLNKAKKAKLKSEIENLTSQGKRLMGLASKVVDSSHKKLTDSDIKDLKWVGLLSFSDPVRKGVKEALGKAEKAGVKVIVITGDYPETAINVMMHIGQDVSKEEIMLGKKLKSLSNEALRKKVGGIKLFARTTPSQKLNIVEALKANGEVVAMMGDGVNDAPALSRADIGIVVGEATDVARESADLVLLDSNFSTIVAAIEEGRGIFDNIRKIVLYLVSDAFGEIIAVVGALLLAFPLPVTASQILWINLVSDGFPNLALTIDPRRHNIMDEPPRSPKEDLVASWMKRLILVVSGVGGVMALLLFIFFYTTTNDLALSQSVAFATLGVNSLVYVFSIRTLRQPFWEENPFSNQWLVIAVMLGLGLQVLPFLIAPVGDFFGVVPLTLLQWVYAFGAAAIMFIIIEVSKVVFRSHLSVKE